MRAEEQQAGRGRRGHVWVAPPGSAILASLVLRPGTPAAEAFAPTMILGTAIRAALRAWDVPAGLKWPNDVLCDDRKIAGILCETALTEGRPDFVVAGFGVNFDFDVAAAGLADVAVTLAQVIPGPLPDREAVLTAILGAAEARYQAWQAGDYAGVWAEWRTALDTLGRSVRIDPGDGPPVVGEALDVARDGALIVGTATGRQMVHAGTVLR